MPVKTQLVTIQTDSIPIDGALHEPDGEIKGSALYFHGNTMNFYTGAARFLPPVLTRLGLAVLAFNRRGHDILTTRASRAAEGGAFQTTAQAIADNRFAAQWMAARGFANPVIMGHSNGGMLSTRHVADHPNTPALVLLSVENDKTFPLIFYRDNCADSALSEADIDEGFEGQSPAWAIVDADCQPRSPQCQRGSAAGQCVCRGERHEHRGRQQRQAHARLNPLPRQAPQPHPAMNLNWRPSSTPGSSPDSAISCASGSTGTLQSGQLTRTRRCATIPFNAETKLYGSTPMCLKRPITSNALLAWTEVKTR